MSLGQYQAVGRDELSPEFLGEGPSCLFQLLGVMGIPELVGLTLSLCLCHYVAPPR